VVIAQFVVTAEGKVEDVAVIKGIEKTLDKEVVKAISKSPDWTPAEQDGEKKAVRLTVPVQFVL
jgi:protein TonB